MTMKVDLKDRYDIVLSHKDRNGATRYTKVGAMFVRAGNDGKPMMSLKFDPGVSVSTPDDVFANVYEPKTNDGPQQSRGGKRPPPDTDPNNGREAEDFGDLPF